MHRLGQPLPKTVAVLRALGFGALLRSVPAFRALRAALPDAEITLIGLPQGREFAKRFARYIDDFIEFPGFPGVPGMPPVVEKIPEFILSIQQRHFDLALQMQGGEQILNSLIRLFRAKRNAGFFKEGIAGVDRSGFMLYPELWPEARRTLKFVEFLGIPLRGEYLEFPLFERDWQELYAIREAAILRKTRYVCIHPGARYQTRRWLPEGFALVADKMTEAGFTVVITGPVEDTGTAGQVSALMKREHVNIVGRTSLGAQAAVLRGARLLVSNDTGVTHIAAAFNVPNVAIVTGSDPFYPATLSGLRRPVYYPIKCRPCGYAVCPIGQPCAKNVSAASVLSQAERFLNAGYQVPSGAAGKESAYKSVEDSSSALSAYSPLLIKRGKGS